MIEIKELNVEVDNKHILKNINLKIEKNTTTAIMGKNGSGKSTLLHAIAGNPAYKITSGDILYNNESILNKTVDERAKLGMFLTFQNPVEVPGLGLTNVMRTAINEKRKSSNLSELDAIDFIDITKQITKKYNISEDLLTRYLNVGFSGGEKKKSEIFQMLVLNPSLVLLDEIDSGLDINALMDIKNILASLKKTYIFVTHNDSLFDVIKLDNVIVIENGEIIKTGDKSLMTYILEKGFDNVRNL